MQVDFFAVDLLWPKAEFPEVIFGIRLLFFILEPLCSLDEQAGAWNADSTSHRIDDRNCAVPQSIGAALDLNPTIRLGIHQQQSLRKGSRNARSY